MEYGHISEAAGYILSKTHIVPEIAIVLGSGFGAFAENLENTVEIPYRDIPEFPVSTVTGHAGRFVFGKYRGKYVIVMQGRVHYYEGYSAQEVAMPVWTLRCAGVKTIILTNAAGGINTSYQVGDLVLISDHINMTGASPLRGVRLSEPEVPIFADMSRAYTPRLLELAEEVGYGLGLNLESGVYACMSGPQYETPAEIKMLRRYGADLVGMSTVFEVIAAAACGMEVLAMSCVTNMAAGIQSETLEHDEVISVAEQAAETFEMLIGGVIERI